jgi:hypothetical protein
MQEVAGERGGYLHGRGGNYLSQSLFLHIYIPPYSLTGFFFFFWNPTSSFTYTFVSFVYAALDSDDLLYLKEQMEAEEDAERLLRRTEKRAFAAFKISFLCSFISNLFPYRLLINEVLFSQS